MPYADPPLAGRYLLLDVVGIGAMGTVWRSWDLRELRFVAVKVLNRLEAPHLLRFVREQSLRIEHPHVAAPTGWVADDDRVAFAMELASGGSVAALRAEHGPLPVSFVVELLDQLLAGLEAVHAAGVVHRDLKPANLLLDATGSGRPRLRIGDFGVAAAVGARSELAGTDRYAAPEQLDGAPPDPRQDLHAVGVLTRELLGGPTGTPLDMLLAALAGSEPHHRPPSAAEARRRLGALPAPARLPRPWVPDRVGVAAIGVPSARRATPDPIAPRPRAALLVSFVGAAALAGGVAHRLLTG